MCACFGIQSGPGEAAGVARDIGALEAGHPALRVGLQQPSGRAWQIGVVEPGVAGHAGHEDDQVSREFAALGDDLFGGELLGLVSEMGLDADPLHLAKQLVDRLWAESVARPLGGGEEDDAEALAPALLAQLPIEPEQELEDRAAAHGRGLLWVAREAHGDGAAIHGSQPIADLLGGGDALTGRDRMLDAGQLFDEAPTAGNDQAVVLDCSGIGLQQAAAVAQTSRRRGKMISLHLAKKMSEIEPRSSPLRSPLGTQIRPG